VPDILLTTLNAKYAHAAFGLRYLLANLGPLRGRAGLCEFDINQRSLDILEKILALEPKVIGIGVYIWNVAPATELVADLKRLRPELLVVLGGPEVSYETESQEIVRLADYVVTGEADLAFAGLCQRLLAGERPAEKIIASPLPHFSQLALPYELYDDHDLAHRVVYVEASRGCPFSCEFCLSSLDVPVRNVPIDEFLSQMQRLLDRGLRRFKFVDRTFNLNLSIGRAILEFFHERYEPGMFLHFEMIPDRLPAALREPISRFPAGALQFEVGIQTLDDDVAARISRRQDNAKVAENLRFLRTETGVYIHADLIVGLPGEGIEGFGRGFDRLVAMDPHEIQVGLLKRLRGTPIVRHDAEWGMVYSPTPPYEILQTSSIDFSTMQRLRRFARYWDMVANSGNFIAATPLLWGEGSPFECFIRFSDWLFVQLGRQHGIALQKLVELLFTYLTAELHHSPAAVAPILWQDYQRGGRSDCPGFLRPLLSQGAIPPRQSKIASKLPKRQSRRIIHHRDTEATENAM